MQDATPTPPRWPSCVATHVVWNGRNQSGTPASLCRGCGRRFVAEPKSGPVPEAINSLNIDDTADLSRPVHFLLLDAEVPIVEHLSGLRAPLSEGFRFFAVPVKVKSIGTILVRAFGLVEGPT